MQKVTKTTQDIEDVNFIIEEVKRFCAMSLEEHRALCKANRQDALCTIPNPFSEGAILVCGRDAYNRFHRIAKRHLATEKILREKFDVEIFSRSLLEEFARIFVKEGRDVDQRWVSKMLSAAVNKLKAKHKTLTHYIPCVIVIDKEPEEFRVGPVRFLTLHKFMRDYEEDLKKERQQLIDDDLKSRQEMIEEGKRTPEEWPIENSVKKADGFVDGLTQYFKRFKWIAEITIPACEERVSRVRAETTIEAALDVLKLFFTEFYGKNLRLGHSRGLPERTANLTRDPDGRLNISLGFGHEHMPGGRNWFEKVTGPCRFYLQAAGEALLSLADPQYGSHLSQRFLDALNWYGQAVTELRPSAQIIKYAAALERLTVTKKEKDLTQVVTRRIALLLHDGDRDEFEKIKKDAGKLYEWRSNLMHGSCSPFDKELESIPPLAEEITRKALFRALELFVLIDNNVEKAKPSDLESKYQSLEAPFIQDPTSEESDADKPEVK